MEDKYKNIIRRHNEDLVKSVVGQDYLQKSIDNCLDAENLIEANSIVWQQHLQDFIRRKKISKKLDI